MGVSLSMCSCLPLASPGASNDNDLELGWEVEPCVVLEDGVAWSRVTWPARWEGQPKHGRLAMSRSWAHERTSGLQAAA